MTAAMALGASGCVSDSQSTLNITAPLAIPAHNIEAQTADNATLGLASGSDSQISQVESETTTIATASLETLETSSDGLNKNIPVPQRIETAQQGIAVQQTAFVASPLAAGIHPNNQLRKTPTPTVRSATSLNGSGTIHQTPNDDLQSAVTPSSDAANVNKAKTIKPRKPEGKSFFASLFKKRGSNAAPERALKVSPNTQPKTAASPIVNLASTGNGRTKSTALSKLFGTDENGDLNETVQLASLARFDPSGLLRQTERVSTSCFKPALVRLIRKIEDHYGKPAVVTSGFRSSKHNRRIGGASGSKHTTCEAADIQISGVSKWELAKYVRTMPERGGVGTYCHTNSVHVDIGSVRDWNWRCRKRKK